MSVQSNVETRDPGRIRLGAAFRLLTPATPALPPAAAPAEVADSGRIRLGAAFRLLAKA
jgi:hypothetical protein